MHKLSKSPRFRMLFFVVMMTMMAIPQFFASAQTLNLDGLVDSVFEQTNVWIPVFGPILAIGGGLTIAVVLVGLIISKIVAGIKGATSG